ncbi:ATP-binding cassette, subfamily C [Caldanaerobius fijiensis DSM 17918]|uniref:ATP-binding cassette, subfamily C n=1 Tax=Caldanaerobius fijiensis DSM 17918 TaxID=1121256 RepID=A0A1M5DW94_9THEO|nr:ATP-binding cassette, subfamily C [Caldanaerobius fijiensis DSM 17918]
MTGLYEPSEGQIFINGIDSRDFDRDEYYRLFSVVFQDIKTVAGLLYVLFELSPIIIALIVLIVIVNTITEKMRQDKDFIFWADNAENNKLFGYLASQVVYDYNAGKYIRLYNVVPLIMERYRKFDRNSLKLFKNIANTDYRFMSISIILGQIEMIAIYGYLAYRVIIDPVKFTIGSFTMYASATTNFASSINCAIEVCMQIY